MTVFQVTMRVVVEVDVDALSDAELEDLRHDYQSTTDEPVADAEWLAEEYAIRQCADAVEVFVEDCHEIRR
jgi:hypothetical protein